MDSAELHAAVYNVVRQIPPRHVTSYGHIAKLIGMPNYSRHVGQGSPEFLTMFLAALMDDVQPPIPWYRVLSASGAISSRGPGTDGANRQRQELEAEGVEVIVGRTGEMRVDLRQWGWFPSVGSINFSDGHELPDDEPEGDGEGNIDEHT